MHKLINRKTGESHLCDKVTIDGFDYYVSDDKIFNGDYCIHPTTLNISQHSFDNNLRLYWKKVIATNNPNIDCPKVIDEIENLCKSNVEKIYSKYIPKDLLDDYITLYKLGYNKSQETYPFSEEDMIEFGNWLNKNASRNAAGTWEYFGNRFYTKTTEELLQLWKEQKPKTIYFDPNNTPEN